MPVGETDGVLEGVGDGDSVAVLDIDDVRDVALVWETVVVALIVILTLAVLELFSVPVGEMVRLHVGLGVGEPVLVEDVDGVGDKALLQDWVGVGVTVMVVLGEAKTLDVALAVGEPVLERVTVLEPEGDAEEVTVTVKVAELVVLVVVEHVAISVAETVAVGEPVLVQETEVPGRERVEVAVLEVAVVSVGDAEELRVLVVEPVFVDVGDIVLLQDRLPVAVTVAVEVAVLDSLIVGEGDTELLDVTEGVHDLVRDGEPVGFVEDSGDRGDSVAVDVTDEEKDGVYVTELLSVIGLLMVAVSVDVLPAVRVHESVEENVDVAVTLPVEERVAVAMRLADGVLQLLLNLGVREDEAVGVVLAVAEPGVIATMYSNPIT
eukprot:gb/GECG01008729.1/.p1 GENE.gb/GECG01008729.1/~~gb/GECG01008729.1/.p1  ORF type:complete len:378 (+),score=61.56 gb/GECG01008729.1/:1-1134(+)